MMHKDDGAENYSIMTGFYQNFFYAKHCFLFLFPNFGGVYRAGGKINGSFKELKYSFVLLVLCFVGLSCSRVTGHRSKVEGGH